MLNNKEFLALSDDESAALEGGLGSPWLPLAFSLISAVVGECIKYSADFVQGFKNGTNAAVE